LPTDTALWFKENVWKIVVDSLAENPLIFCTKNEMGDENDAEMKHCIISLDNPFHPTVSLGYLLDFGELFWTHILVFFGELCGGKCKKNRCIF
jgi:hypothetical protein